MIVSGNVTVRRKPKDGQSVTVSGQSITYAVSSSGTTAPTGGWSTSIPSVPVGSYLWSKTVVTYSDGNSTTTYSCSYQGKDGTDGADGTSVSITGQSVKYAVTASATQPADSKFTSTTIPSLSPGDYLWSLTTVTYSNGVSTKAYQVSRIGADGSDGQPGASGTDGKTSYVHFAYATGADGSEGFSTTYFEGAMYVGTCTDFSEDDPSDYKAYAWARLKGEPGKDGENYWRSNDTIDLRNYDEDKWIPVVGDQLPLYVPARILVYTDLYHSGIPSWATNAKGFSMIFDVSMQGSQWGNTTAKTIIYRDEYKWCDVSPVSISQILQLSYAVLYLRGGGKYYVQTDTDSLEWTAYPEGHEFTLSNGATVSVTPVDSRPDPEGTSIMGKDGVPGPAGADGRTSYFHVKYSSKENPETAEDMTETPAAYIGTYVDFTQEDSNDPSVYTWYRFQGLQGADGKDGIPGKNGTDGKTSYLHIKYSDDGKTFTADGGETPGAYIGQYVDYTQADSNVFSDYTWSRIRGADGQDGKKWSSDVWLDTRDYDESLWIPFTGTVIPHAEGCIHVRVTAELNDANPPSWATHAKGFSVDFEFDMYRNGWGAGASGSRIVIYSDAYRFCEVSPVSCGQMSYQSIPVLYLRGGGRYRVRADYDVEWTARPDGYTWSGSGYTQSVSPQSSRPIPEWDTLKPQYIHIKSWYKGCDIDVTGNAVSIKTNNPLRRGFNVVILDRKTLAVRGSRTFDTYNDSNTGPDSLNEFLAYLDAQANDVFVCIGSYDYVRWTVNMENRLKKLGLESLPHRETGAWPFCFVGYRGLEPGYAAMAQVPLSTDVAWTDRVMELMVYTEGGLLSTQRVPKSIQEVTNRYAVSSSATTAPAEWSESVPQLTSTDKYLWNYETVTYSDGSTSETAKRVIGVYGDKGASGVGISGITEYYLATDAGSGVTASTSGWTTTVQTISKEKRYLWNYEVVTYTDGNKFTSTPVIIGTYGTGVATVDVQFAGSESNTTPPTSGWQTDAPEAGKHSFIWQRTVVTYTDGTSTRTEPVCYTGRGIKRVAEFYGLSDSFTEFTGSSWSTVMPEPVEGKYIWTMTQYTYTDGTTRRSDPICATGQKGDKGDDGEKGDKGDDGEDAVRYWLSPSVTVVKKLASGAVVPAIVSCGKRKQTGNGPVVEATDAKLKYSVSTDTTERDYTGGGLPSRNVEWIKFFLYSSSNELLDSVTVPVVSDGADGADGKDGADGMAGCIQRQSAWMEGAEYRNDEAQEEWPRYVDCVLFENSGTVSGYDMYLCKATHIASTDNDPRVEITGTATESTHWKKMGNLAPVFTPFLVAGSGYIKLFQGNRVLVTDAQGNVYAALHGGDIPLWVGSESPDTAPFSVDMSGRLKAMEGIFGGSLEGAEGSFKELTCDSRDTSSPVYCYLGGSAMDDILGEAGTVQASGADIQAKSLEWESDNTVGADNSFVKQWKYRYFEEKAYDTLTLTNAGTRALTVLVTENWGISGTIKASPYGTVNNESWCKIYARPGIRIMNSDGSLLSDYQPYGDGVTTESRLAKSNDKNNDTVISVNGTSSLSRVPVTIPAGGKAVIRLLIQLAAASDNIGLKGSGSITVTFRGRTRSVLNAVNYFGPGGIGMQRSAEDYFRIQTRGSQGYQIRAGNPLLADCDMGILRSDIHYFSSEISATDAGWDTWSDLIYTGTAAVTVNLPTTAVKNRTFLIRGILGPVSVSGKIAYNKVSSQRKIALQTTTAYRFTWDGTQWFMSM